MAYKKKKKVCTSLTFKVHSFFFKPLNVMMTQCTNSFPKYGYQNVTQIVLIVVYLLLVFCTRHLPRNCSHLGQITTRIFHPVS